ncbi:MAG: response regulator [Candidatus Thermoplasmatota archaeon]|nr:response regulator [Candidatus Thermoplasmatota archaeon]
MKKKIMIVDDEPDIIFSIRKVLEEKAGDLYNIVSAENGKQCLELLKNDEMPDLILLDIMMPEMNGWVLYDMIKNNASWKDIPVVFLTARKDKLAVGAGELLGDDYITKPFESEGLVNRIDKVLKKH